MKLRETVHYRLIQHAMVVGLFLLCLMTSIQITGSSLTEVLGNLSQANSFISQFSRPSWEYFPLLIVPIIKTIEMSIAGTFLGLLLALPFAFLGTTVVTKNVWIAWPVRFLLGMVRTVPQLLLAALLVAMFGIGDVTGTLTIAIFTFGMLSQLIYEAIETIDRGPIEAAISVGATKFQVLTAAIWPQVINSTLGYTLYAFEINIRASVVLGYVGAGGVGVMLNASLALMRYDRVSLIILVILGLVIILDCISEQLRGIFS